MRVVRRGRCPPSSAVLLLAAVSLLNASFTSVILGNRHPPSPFFCLADASADEDDDFLAEILAEQAREEEELARMEAEAREFDAMNARMPGGGGMPKGGPNMGKTGGAGRTMPQGARGNNFAKMEEDLKKQEAQKTATKASQEEEQAAQEAERIRQKREAAFEAELKRMNQEQRKKAQRQKARDAKVVKRILKAHKSGKHYAVLGIRNVELQIGPFHLFKFSLGPFILFRVKTKEIKRVYRNLARTVHPDKNRDGRAEEAFHALEASAAILTDEKQRKEYDRKIIAARRRRNKYAAERVVGAGQVVWSKGASTARMAKRVLGPFSTPILVVGALII
ncbi:hypothetical protein ACHAXT_012265 [Thalassiosira profunda]